MDIGYARVSTGEQTLDLQLDALTKAGCGKVYQETASGAKAERPVLDEVLGYLRMRELVPGRGVTGTEWPQGMGPRGRVAAVQALLEQLRPSRGTS